MPAAWPFRLRLVWACVALAVFAGAAAAQAPDFPSADATAAAGREPITPVPDAPDADPLKVSLGEQLFEDRRLSRDGTRACFSCHDTRGNGADTRRHDLALDGSELPLNTNSLFNATLSFRLNWEGNFRTPEAQAKPSLTSTHHMSTPI